jgi:hypothetical protein
VGPLPIVRTFGRNPFATRQTFQYNARQRRLTTAADTEAQGGETCVELQ